ncbi:MAG: hypothetical protein HDS18_00385 [Bacteroides sp.]|nr:hypothetical protein [Bacteroides sp.]
MARFTIEAKTQIFTPTGRFPSGTTVTLNLPAPAMANTFLTNPDFKNSIVAQFRNQGIDISPNQLGYGFWKVTDAQR